MPRRPVTNWAQQPLGRVPDRVIAARLGVSQAAVWRWRAAAGIPGYRRTYANHGRVRPLLREYVLRAITQGHRTPRDIYSALVDDYGTISLRQIERALRQLQDDGVIEFVREPGARSCDWYYTRTRRRPRERSAR